VRSPVTSAASSTGSSCARPTSSSRSRRSSSRWWSRPSSGAESSTPCWRSSSSRSAVAARAAARFADLGCHVEEVDPGIPDPWEIVDTIWGPAQATPYLHTYLEVRDRLDPARLPIIERGFKMHATALHDAQRRRIDYHAAWCAFMERYDLLLTPQLPVTAFPVQDDYPREINGREMTYLGWTPFTYPFNLTGQPAASVPCGTAHGGLPVGLQLVGRWRDDATVLRAAAAFEQLAPWAHHRPPEG
jgi:aspartyl-tRNA(Asn)/glutamyl-tRNA(Gln) amidotransferase subunit A